MNIRRADRVADEIMADMGQILLRNAKDPRIGFITITRVTVDDALKNVDIYFTKLGGPQQKEAALEGLVHAKSFFRRELARGLRLKSMPSLRFHIDNDFEKTERIQLLLEKINSNTNEQNRD